MHLQHITMYKYHWYAAGSVAIPSQLENTTIYYARAKTAAETLKEVHNRSISLKGAHAKPVSPTIKFGGMLLGKEVVQTPNTYLFCLKAHVIISLLQ